MGHTKGPWKVIREEWKSLSIHGSDDRFIADVSLHYDTAESNARLIAASPRLYEYVKVQAMKGDSDAAKIIAECQLD